MLHVTEAIPALDFTTIFVFVTHVVLQQKLLHIQNEGDTIAHTHQLYRSRGVYSIHHPRMQRTNVLVCLRQLSRLKSVVYLCFMFLFVLNVD